MFQHIVLYKLKDGSGEQKKNLKEKFLSMDGKIPQIKELRVGTDVSLSIMFDSKEDFFAYKEYPYHKDEVVPYVHSVVEKSVSVDSDF